ncbi:queuosine precursor transporter [Hoeflea sp. WL0058]|uniref:Probable queuosine precursor transporter n=1 Tax=Flavimaribacter sediminis TaxID=2865987 RepID=A0AAE2ZPG2_9HYPH|nr:queuosine precursor transporter [Flavimaribacter sediminis]MBW8640594.1 queuosine precursor transporter [Flavimaribacter sediminis]
MQSNKSVSASETTFGRLVPFIIAMALVVIASNYLVQFPVFLTIGELKLDDLLTWGAFTYPVAFLVTDLSNRKFGPRRARVVVFTGFVFAVFLSWYLSTPRIAIASGSAFLVAQLLDVTIFNRLRNSFWWHAPLVSSFFGSIIDTLIFFSLAFAASFSFIGPNDAFAIDLAPLAGVVDIHAPRWVSWAIGDLTVKLLVALALLAPYRVVIAWTHPAGTTA